MITNGRPTDSQAIQEKMAVHNINENEGIIYILMNSISSINVIPKPEARKCLFKYAHSV